MADGGPRLVMLAGATGFVGGFALESLLDASDVARVFAVTRRPLGREHPRLANRIVQFDSIESQLKGLSCHAALCCLGTTIRQAGSQEAFRKVDLECVLAFARTAKAAQAQRFVVVSSVAADPGSRNFYLRTKGEMEQALAALGFASLEILQPGVLLGWRHAMRPLELAARLAMPLINPFLIGEREQYRGIPARTVGEAMAGVLRSSRRGVQRYTYAGIQGLARLKPARALAKAASSPEK
ncbi:MAG TPA: NAD(P)H-binding protein [Steroidobacteraceae bacterium]|nr:NAD(P)H-binding protein [Steroidobacteraceae bacterium]